MANNKIVNVIEQVLALHKENKSEEVPALLSSLPEEYVTIKDVTVAFMEYMDELADYTDVAMAINQQRTLMIVESLDESTQEKIKQKFIEAEDNMFSPEGEQE